MRFSRGIAQIMRNNNEKRMLAHGNKCLRAKWMPLHKIECVGQFPGYCIEQADPGASFAKIKFCQVVKAAAHALVDDHVRVALTFENVPKWRESLRGQRPRGDVPVRTTHVGSMSRSRSSAIRSTCRKAVSSSASRSFASRSSNARMMPALSWSRTAMMNGNPNFEV